VSVILRPRKDKWNIVGKWSRRPSRGYDGIQSPAREIRQLLPDFLKKIDERYLQQPQKVLESWTSVAGKKLASQTRAAVLRKGVLVVEVENSTLLSMLHHYEKEKLLKGLQKRFSRVVVKDILFRLK
jgi:hypothetical protein